MLETKFIPITLQLKKPILSKSTKFIQREIILFVIEYENTIGVGEIAPLSDFSQESLSDSKNILSKWINYNASTIRYILKQSVANLSPESLLKMLSIDDGSLDNMPASAKLALELSILNWICIYHNKNICDILALKPHDNLPTSKLIRSIDDIYILITDIEQRNNIDDNIANNSVIDNSIADNYKIKVGICSDIDEEISAINNLAKSIANFNAKFSNKSTIRLDINARWSYYNTVNFTSKLNTQAKKLIEWIEDPLPLESPLEDYERFHHKTGCHYALDESLRVMTNDNYQNVFDSFFMLKGLSSIIIKPMLMGSILSTLILAEKLRNKALNNNQIDVILSSSYESPITLNTYKEFSYILPKKQSHGINTSDIFTDESLLILDKWKIN